MNDQFWNYIITAVGLTGFFLAGRKVWWCWYVNILNQVLWFTYGWATEQWGFVVGTIPYTVVFVKNAYEWTKEHRGEVAYRKVRANRPPGKYSNVSVNFKFDAKAFQEQLQKSMSSTVFASNAFRKVSPYKPRGRFCPWWFHKRFHKNPLPIKDGIDGPKVGEITDVEETEEGLWVTGKIDRDTPEGQAVWEKISGPPTSFSIPEDYFGECESSTTWQGREVECELDEHILPTEHQAILQDAMPPLLVLWSDHERPAAGELS